MCAFVANLSRMSHSEGMSGAWKSRRSISFVPNSFPLRRLSSLLESPAWLCSLQVYTGKSLRDNCIENIDRFFNVIHKSLDTNNVSRDFYLNIS